MGNVAPLWRALLLTALTALFALPVPSTASAADSVYWSNINVGTIRVANLDGSGAAATLFTEPGGSSPTGVAIDLAAGRVYWADSGADAIRVANLDGSGDAETLFTEPAGSFPLRVAIDPAAGRIYWSDALANTIRVANLDGSGSPSTLFTEPGGSTPVGVAIDPAAGKIYWGNQGPEQIRVANLDGSGSPTTLFTDPGGSDPSGVALDVAAGTMYWADQGGNTIRVANMDGSGSASTLFAEPGGSGPVGVALDAAANEIYWADSAANTVRVASLDGSGSPSTLFTEPGSSAPVFPAFARAPLGTGAPAVSGGGTVGEQLDCSEGSWASDQLGAFAFRVPRSFAYQWRRDGSDIPGATEQTFVPTEPGSYACRVTASNHAGDTSQTSDPQQVVALPPVCEAVSTTAPHNQSVELDLDCSGDGPLTYSIVAGPSDGTISSFDSTAGTLTYTPDSGFAGDDSFTYRASNPGGASNDAIAAIVVSAPPRPAPPDNEFSVSDVHKQKHKGKARITLDLPGPGRVELDGELVKQRRKRASGAGQLVLSITATGNAKERLRETRKATVSADITFTPDGGDPSTKTQSVTLVRRR